MSVRITLDYFKDATVAVTPAASPNYPVTNLQSSNRDARWRAPNNNRQIITGDWGGDIHPIACFSVHPARGNACLIGSRWQLEGYSELERVNRVINTGTLDFYPYAGTGYAANDYVTNPYGVPRDDRLARIAPLTRYFTEQGIAAFTITIDDDGALDTPFFEASRIVMGENIDFPYGALLGAAPSWNSATILRRSLNDALRRLVRGKHRELRIQTVLSEEADRAKIQSLLGVIPPDVEILLSCFPGDLNRLERDFSALGSLAVVNPLIWENSNFHRLDLALTES